MSAKCQKRTSGSFKNNKLDFAESADKAPSRKSRTHSSHLERLGLLAVFARACNSGKLLQTP